MDNLRIIAEQKLSVLLAKIEASERALMEEVAGAERPVLLEVKLAATAWVRDGN